MMIQQPRLKAAIFVLLCAAPLLGSVLVWQRGETVIPLAAYGLVSVIAFFLSGATSARRALTAGAPRKTSCTPWNWRAAGRGR